MQNLSVATHRGRALSRATNRKPLLSATLLVSVGLSLSTLSSPGWAQTDTTDAATLPSVSVSASRDTAAAQADTVSAGALVYCDINNAT